jgi:hypothetical protein
VARTKLTTATIPRSRIIVCMSVFRGSVHPTERDIHLYQTPRLRQDRASAPESLPRLSPEQLPHGSPSRASRWLGDEPMCRACATLGQRARPLT